MTKTTVTVTCDRCEGKGEICDYEVGSGGRHMWPCGTCLGKGCVEQVIPPVNPDFARAIAMLASVVPRLPYVDRKRLEQEVSDALFKGEVDPLTREAWQSLVNDLQRVEGT